MSFSHLLPVPFLTSVLATGTDAVDFLQGQLSTDARRLENGLCQLSSLNSPQGRVQAILTLVPRSDGILMLLPSVIAASTLARLRKYVLRSKVTLIDLSEQVDLFASNHALIDAAGLPCPTQPGRFVEHEGIGILRWHETGPGLEERYLVIAAPTGKAAEAKVTDAAWRLADIRAGLPQVLPETYETFVAQMLNLDLLGGISFDKGCYTGQEIIARTHYRGAIKRRMFRFQAPCPPPSPGTRVLYDGSHAGDVVDAAATMHGCELLAVVNLAQKDEVLELADMPGTAMQRLPLPYEEML